MENRESWQWLLSHDDYEIIMNNIKVYIMDSVFTPDPIITFSSSIILNHYPNTANKDVLDLWCGTGILGINALRNWAKSVVFTDVNLKALINTRHNLSVNKLVDSYLVIESDLFEKVNTQFDYIFANLPISNTAFVLNETTQDIVIRFIREYKNFLKEDGKAFLARWSFEDITPLLQVIDSMNQKYQIIEESKLWFLRYLLILS